MRKGNLDGGDGAAAGTQSIGALQDFLTRAALRGERSWAITRLIVSVLVFGRFLIWGGAAGLASGSFKHWLGGLSMTAGIAFSILTLARLRSIKRLDLWVLLSVAMDLVLVTSVLVTVVYWPAPTYPGVLRIPDVGVYLMAIAGTGIRLSRRAALYGPASMVAAQVGLLVLDGIHNPGRITYGPAEMVLWGGFFVGAWIFAWVIVARTQRLVFDGAEAALNAERARQRLGVYVSAEVAREALASDELEVGGSRQPVAVLFCDLRGFTRYSEKLPPERLVAELNAWLDAMVRAIRQEGGVVDKFMGDAVMAVFGVPKARPDDAARALRTARAMQDALAEHNRERAAEGKAPFQHGIGIHFGTAVAGNIGNEERLQYTVIGDAVNLASRLQTATKAQRVPVLLSADAVEAARKSGEPLPALAAVGTITVPGREAKIEVFTLAEAAEAERAAG